MNCKAVETMQHNLEQIAREKVSTKVLLGITALAVAILTALFGTLYSQNAQTADKLAELIIEQRVLRAQFSTFVDSHQIEPIRKERK